MDEPTSELPVDTAAFAFAASLCARGRDDLVRRGHAPEGRKRLRRFGLAEVARWLLPVDAAALRATLDAEPDLPQGERDGGQVRFTLDEVVRLRERFVGAGGSGRTLLRRPSGAGAKIVAVANFKGGVGKTSTAANLAMAAALEGLRVLAVDLDSQGSLTSMFGGVVTDEWQTAFPLIARDFARENRLAHPHAPLDDTLGHALGMGLADLVQPTPWSSIDLVGAQLNLYWAEFQIPVWRLALDRWRLWDALGRALEADGALRDYDLVVLDTPPALGYLTINALAAADVLIVPLGASFLEFDSTGRFFDMIHATFASIEAGESRGARAAGLGQVRFEWDAVKALITRYDPSQQAEMADLIQAYLGEFLCRHRQEHTVLVGQAAERVDGIYEADPRDFNRDTYARGRDTFDGTWAEIRGLLDAAWRLDATREAGNG
jgi:chromosome partitioning protein